MKDTGKIPAGGAILFMMVSAGTGGPLAGMHPKSSKNITNERNFGIKKTKKPETIAVSGFFGRSFIKGSGKIQ